MSTLSTIPMATLFEVEDPRGIKVICDEENWQHHILAFHPELEGSLEEIRDTITAPFSIYQDAIRENRQAYYRRTDRWMKVIVEAVDENTFELITAFQTDSGKKGERWIWPD